MGAPRTQPEVQKKEWHSTYYKLMKKFVMAELRLSTKDQATQPAPGVISQLASISRDMAQVFKLTNDSQSSTLNNFAILKSNYSQLGTNPKNQDALAAFKRNEPDINELSGSVNAIAEQRKALSERVKIFLEKTSGKFPEIDQALEKGDIANAEALLKELSTEVKTLKIDLKTLQDQESKTHDRLERLNTIVTTAVNAHISGANAQTLGEAPPRPE